MAQTKDAPSSRDYSHFICEQAVVTDINRKTWTVTAETIHSSKTFRDIQCGSPYSHHEGGAGIHVMPEVGATCWVASPSDNTPAFILAFGSFPSVLQEAEGTAAGMPSDVSYRANRPEMNPGDIGITTRDGNFVMLRRGGIIQIGATPIAQRIYVPVRNFIRDFAQNYEMATMGGDLTWLVEPPELDPLGKAACTWSLQLREFATDKKASVRIRHMPLQSPGGKKAAWEVTVAPQGIDERGVSGEAYSLMILMDGTKSEVIGASRSTTVRGNDTLVVEGDRSVEVKGTNSCSAQDLKLRASRNGVFEAKKLKLGGEAAVEGVLLGDTLIRLLLAEKLVVTGTTASFAPTALATLRQALSNTVFVKK